jgi:hypothetical protein
VPVARPNTPPGPGVDATGQAVVDPTANVLSLVEAANRRQDDLRAAEARRVDDIGTLRASYDAALRTAESARIDAIRAVDVGAVNRAAEVSAAQATTLAAQVATSAETLRSQVQAAAAAATVALAAALEPIQKDIADLRRVQYEQQGQKAGVADQRSTSTDNRAWLFGSIGALVAGAALIGPHIH